MTSHKAMQKLKYFLPLLVFVLLGLLFLKGLELDPQEMPSALIDKPMPAFNLPQLENSALLTTDDLKGKPFLLNVWATWCVSCKVEHPYLMQLAEQGVRIIGINYKDDNAKALEWLKKLGNPYEKIIVDADGKLGIDLGVFGAPETYLVDAEGIIRAKHVGVIDARVWQRELAAQYHGL